MADSGAKRPTGSERIRLLHIQNLSGQEIERLGDKRFISGHLLFLCIREFPILRTFRVAVSLREPCARVASAMRMLDRFTLKGNETQLNGLPVLAQASAARIAGLDFRSASALSRYLETAHPLALSMFDNCQTPFLASVPIPDRLGIVGRPVTDQDVPLAIESLRAANFICLAEKLPESLDRLARALGKTVPTSIPRSNSADSAEWAPAREFNHLDPAIQAALRPMVRYDIEIYQRALEFFNAGGSQPALEGLDRDLET